MTDMKMWDANRNPSLKDTAKTIATEYESVLSDATDESSLQTFLAAHPSILSSLALPGGDYWCLDRPRLGSEFIPDFLLASRTSVGIKWVMIELESPLEKALTKAGLPAKKAAEGLKQIRDWRGWIRENVSYAHTQLGLNDIDAECPSFLIIGRRSSLDPKQSRIYRELSGNNTTVMSYDRLQELLGRNINMNGV